MHIADLEVGYGKRPLVIAEIGAAHNCSLETALKLIRAAKAAGADLVKIQALLPDTITRDFTGPEFTIRKGPWAGRHLHELYTVAHMPRAWFGDIFALGREIGIPIFPSVFSLNDLEFVRQFEPPAYKIASFELVDTMLVQAVADERRPVILSTGMASWGEVRDAADRVPVDRRVLLHCISSYPTDVEKANLSFMDVLRREAALVGLSDHTTDYEVAMMAVAREARVIEKHITLTPGGAGLDDGFALDALRWPEFVRSIHRAWAAVGDRETPRDDSEHASLRRSLYVGEDVMEGHQFTAHNVESIRPGLGLAPRYLPQIIIGMRATMDIPAGTPLAEHHLNHKLEERR